MSGESEPSILCTSVSRTQFVLLIRPLGLVSFVISIRIVSLSISKTSPSQVSTPSASSKSLADKIALTPGALFDQTATLAQPSASPLLEKRDPETFDAVT